MGGYNWKNRRHCIDIRSETLQWAEKSVKTASLEVVQRHVGVEPLKGEEQKQIFQSVTACPPFKCSTESWGKDPIGKKTADCSGPPLSINYWLPGKDCYGPDRVGRVSSMPTLNRIWGPNLWGEGSLHDCIGTR